MARDHAKHSPVSLMSTFLVTSVSLLLIQGVWSQRVRVDLEIEAYPTESVDLRCRFIDGGGGKTKLTQVSWIWEPVEGKRDNIAVFHPIYGESFPESPFKSRTVFIQGTLENPSIRISQLTMADAGRYTCEYATYPSGNEQGTTNLVMLAKPRNSASALTVQAGGAAVTVAECEAADGKPAATIKWLAPLATGNSSTSTRPGADGTVTVRSEYRMAPNATDNGMEVTCIISQRTQDKPQTFPLTLSVEHPPTLTIGGYDNNWYVGRSNAVLICQAISNPPPTSITWTTLSGPLPATVEVEDNKLTVRRVDDAVNTTFVCEVTNRLGVAKQHFTTFVSEAQVDPSSVGVVAGAVIGSLLALLLVAALVAVLFNRGRRQQRRGYPSNGASGTSTAGGAGGYGNKARLLFGGAPGNKNAAGANNNGPVYTYREGCDATGTLTEKPGDYHLHHHLHPSAGTTPTAHDILLSSEMDEAERRKFDALDDSLEEEEEERYDRFGVGGGRGGGGGVAPPYHIRRHGDEEMGVYLDDDMESQRDGSVISRTAIYV